MAKNGSVDHQETDITEQPPDIGALPETGSMSAKELRAFKAKSEINRRDLITRAAINIFWCCVIFIFAAYVLEIIASFLPWPRTDGDAKNILTLIQYITAGLIGYLFGQSGSRE